MTGSLRALLRELFDYAGLFPPAGLGMSEAVARYATYRGGPNAWMLGRFVLPVARLAEFATAAGDGYMYAAEPWRLAVILGDDPAAGYRAICAFNQRGGAVVDTAEGRGDNADDIKRLGDGRLTGLTMYVELPPAAGKTLVDTVATIGARAKIRAGGLTAQAFPTHESLLRFMSNCQRSGVPWKATAGLHHAIRAPYRLTYEPNAASAPMFGFLNLAMAAALLYSGAAFDTLAGALAEQDVGMFRFVAGAASWNGHQLDTAQIEASRAQFVAIGSCSFEEPVAELEALGLLDKTIVGKV